MGRARRTAGLRRGAGALLLALAVAAPAAGQDPAEVAGDILQAGCKSCGTGGLHAPAADDTLCGDGGRGDCYPGRDGCHTCTSHTRFGQFVCGLYEAVCCPDPCYQPKWIPLADAAFFTAAARPVTHTRFRGTLGRRLGAPDRSEWFWARADGRGKGPSPRAPLLGETRVDWNQFSIYTEAASGAAGVFTDIPYRSVTPDIAPFGAGFADMTVGTKALLFDTELLQVAFQFSTYIPLGNFRKGLGTGHVSLEPSVIAGLKLTPLTYVQIQVAQWIPIAGDRDYAGSMLHYHFALNRELCRPLPDVPVIGVCELSGYSFQDGAFTDPFRGAFQRGGGTTYLTLGPGVRTSVCDRIDFGIGSAFSVGNRSAPQQEYRIEFRARF